MNYPYRKAVIDFLRQRDDGKGFREAVMTIAENYPPQVLACCMNHLGTHDTPRILTALMDDFEGSRAEKAARHLSPGQLLVAKERLRMASFLQFVLPGAPSGGSGPAGPLPAVGTAPAGQPRPAQSCN